MVGFEKVCQMSPLGATWPRSGSINKCFAPIRMRKTIQTFLFFLLLANGFAQECNFTLLGKITDKDDGEPLEFTIVSVKEINFSTNSNDKGEFKIEKLCAGDYTLRIIHLGCADTSI